MLKPTETAVDNDLTIVRQTRFPYIHFLLGLILSFCGYVVLFYIDLFVELIISSVSNKSEDIHPVSFAWNGYIIPEYILLAILIFLSINAYRRGKTGYMLSYIILLIINAVCFGVFWAGMSSIHC